MPNIDVSALLTTLPIMFIALILLFLFMYIYINGATIKKVWKGNTLIWRHPENTNDRNPCMDIVKMTDAPGINWIFKTFFFMPEKPMKWCYEIQDVDKETGEITYSVSAFIPEDFIDYKGKTVGELLDALSWDCSVRIKSRKVPFLEKLAHGSMLLMGVASLFGIFVLLDMIGK